MAFFVYMLECADRSIYTGHTDSLEARLGAHYRGTFKGYTSTRRPLRLLFTAEFPTRYEALSAERQIKGWCRAKKYALSREDWEEIKRLART
jgi:predicted GIY-YIG superfamily endonuclease